MKAFCAATLADGAIVVGTGLGIVGIMITNEAAPIYKIGAMFGLGGLGLAAVGIAGSKIRLKNKSMWDHVIS